VADMLAPVSADLEMMHDNKRIFEKYATFVNSNFHLTFGFIAVTNQPLELRV
jgi:hypothetical protein